MTKKAFIKNKRLHIFDENAEKELIKQGDYSLGTVLAGFLRVDVADTEKLYDEFIKSALSIKGGRFSAEQEESLSAKAKLISKDSQYLCYYIDILKGVLISAAAGKLYDMAEVFKLLPKTNELYEQYQQRFDSDSENADSILAPFYSMDYLESRPASQKRMMLRSINNILYIKEAIILDIKEKKEFLANAVSYIYGDEEKTRTGTVSALQKLYVFDMLRSNKDEKPPFLINKELKSEFAPFLHDNPFSFEAEMDNEFENQNEIEINELYCVDWADDLIRLELLKTAEQNAVIKKCANCGMYFAPSGRTDAIYCSMEHNNTGKTCAEIGAIKKYKLKTEDNPAHDAFTKAYKRYNSRVRNNKMSKQEFELWLKDAKQKREECLSGKITVDEFSALLGNKR